MTAEIETSTRPCRKPCSDEVSPRLPGNRSGSNSAGEGTPSADPVVCNTVGRTCPGTPGDTSQRADVGKHAGERKPIAEVDRSMWRGGASAQTLMR
ncbi:MAG: hypothetical protein IPJ62_11645 [Betaproteobacteria bacterium]|nr:hypothetical protein [Betaproteobacteria bacterium]